MIDRYNLFGYTTICLMSGPGFAKQHGIKEMDETFPFIIRSHFFTPRSVFSSPVKVQVSLEPQGFVS